MVLRLLLPIVAVLTLLASSAMGWAAAGPSDELACCCPNPDRCKCHDHDGDPPKPATLKRCSGDIELVAPVVAVAIVHQPRKDDHCVVARSFALPAIHPLENQHAPEIEIPPF